MTGMKFLLPFLFVSSLLLEARGWPKRPLNIQSPKVPQSLHLTICNNMVFKEKSLLTSEEKSATAHSENQVRATC